MSIWEEKETTTTTPQGSFWDSVNTARPDINKINSETAQFKQEAERANSIGGFLKNFGGALVSNTVQLGKDILRAGPRAAASVTQSFTGQEVLKPETLPEKIIYGNDPIKSVPKRIEDSSKELQEYGVNANISAPLAGVGVLGLTALDLLPIGPSKATKVTLTESGLETLSKELSKNTDVTTIISTLKRSGFTDDVAKKIATPLVDITTPESVKSFLSPITKTATGVERAHITAYKAADNVSPNIAEQASKEAGTILPRSTSKLEEESRNLIASNIDEAMTVARGTDDKAIATGDMLVEHFSKLASETTDRIIKDNYEKQAVQFAVETATKLTELGRAIQAAFILAKTNPAGFIRWAVTQAKKSGFEIPTDVMSKLIEDANKLPTLPEGEARNRLIFDMANRVKSFSNSNMWEKMTTVWKAGLLTGVKTSGLNIFSNFFHGVAEAVKEVPATMTDAIVSFKTGERTKGLTLRGFVGGGVDGVQKGFDYLKTGYDPRDFDAKLDWTKTNFGKGPVAKFFQKYTDIVFRVLGAEDQPFYYGAAAHSIASQAIAASKNQGLKGQAAKDFVDQFIKNPPEEAVSRSMIDASTAVFQQDTFIGGLASSGVNWAKSKSGFGGAVIETIMPFRKTPAGVAMQIFNYTPAGAVAEIAKQINRGKFDQRLFSDAIGRSITGAGIIYLGSKLFEKGMITLGYPSDPKEQARWEAEGRKENSILIDGKWRGLNTLGPAGNVITVGGYYQKALEESGSQSEALTKAILTVPKTVLDQTFLRGMSSAMDALQDPERYLETFVNGLSGSVVPTIVSDVAQATDPIQRKIGSSQIGNPVDAVAARIPGARQTLEPKVNALGEERQRAGNPLETMFDPTRPSRVNSEPVITEGERLAKEGYEVLPTKLGGSDGYESLTQEENTKLLKLRGQLFKEKIGKAIQDPQYKELSDKEKANVFNNFASTAGEYARAKVIFDKIQGMSPEQTKSELSKYKKEKLLTQEVFKLLAPSLNL